MITFAPPATVSAARVAMSASGSRNVGDVIPWSSAQMIETPSGSITRLSRIALPDVRRHVYLLPGPRRTTENSNASAR